MTELSRPDERKVYCRLLIGLMRLSGSWRQVPPVGGFDGMLIVAAIVLAALEGRPYRPLKLAEFLGMPRTTLLRRIEELAAEGSVVVAPKGELLPGPKLADAETEIVLDSLRGLLLATTEELQKSDTGGKLYDDKIVKKGVQNGHKAPRQESGPKVKSP